ncbi:MAG: hypothetical protein K2H53_06090 [Clostridia bacterium]|nr:hypothetical protein [Clostridia bacterium]
MENAADALKIAFAIMIFALAVTVLFYTASLVRSVSESVLLDSDKTRYYSYYESDENSVDKNGNRIVTLEDIIPTMYRYHTESAAVTIIDKKGEIVTRLDRQTETLCTNWNNRTQKQKEIILNEINYILKYCNGANLLEDVKELEELFRKIYKQDPNDYYKKQFDCPWNGLESLTAQRIDSDLSGIKAYFSIRQPGKQINLDSEDAKKLANHIPCLGEGKSIIDEFENSRFTEYLVLYDTNNYITDDEDGDRLYAARRT